MKKGKTEFRIHLLIISKRKKNYDVKEQVLREEGDDG